MKALKLVWLILVAALLLGCTQQAAVAPEKEVVRDVNNANSDSAVAVPAATGVKGESLVVVENNQFSPETLEVKVGDSVQWVNREDVSETAGMTDSEKQELLESKAQTVTFENGDVDHGLAVGESFEYTFMTAGEFRYFSLRHPGVNGVVVVK